MTEGLPLPRWELWHGTYIVRHLCGHEQQYPGPDNDMGLSPEELREWPNQPCLRCWLDDPERWESPIGGYE